MDLTIKPYRSRTPISFSSLWEPKDIKNIQYSGVVKMHKNVTYYRLIRYGEETDDTFYVKSSLKIKKLPRGGIVIIGISRIISDIGKVFII